ncbi:nitrile hydratase subunit alpha [Antrihabitans stalactiti]|uniref:nitrile hydratase n=1 Tax=Antrihabitans stalactiti TaxID=2584121 RepID=A0A848KSQ2_9NOCA|nr:nitrile hydratase subunit alpha [Antrihabitans stalactiti]NMN99532.1 nitrile hydratase subunit alpha [Antrihabitans stalactiti]
MSVMIEHDQHITNAPGVPEQAPARDRAWALHEALNSKGHVPDGYAENWKKTFEEDFTPRKGAELVARAWTDPEFRELLLTDGTAAVGQYGYLGPQGEYITALEDTPTLKNVIVCSLCSCTAWPILGLPPTWYKSFEYRARVVREPRKVLEEMGTTLPEDVTVKVVDTTAETRFMVLPVRPAGTEGWTAQQLQQIVTKDVLIGVAVPQVP